MNLDKSQFCSRVVCPKKLLGYKDFGPTNDFSFSIHKIYFE